MGVVAAVMLSLNGFNPVIPTILNNSKCITLTYSTPWFTTISITRCILICNISSNKEYVLIHRNVCNGILCKGIKPGLGLGFG